MHQTTLETTNLFPQPESTRKLIMTTLANSLWLLSRSLKMILILNKEMVSWIFRKSDRARNRHQNQNIYNHFGVWLIDLPGLIHEQMGIE